MWRTLPANQASGGSVLSQDSTTPAIDGVVDASVAAKKGNSKAVYQPLYNEGYFAEFKVRYSNALQKLSEKPVLDEDLLLVSEELQKVSEEIRCLLSCNATENESRDASLLKWNKLLFLSQKNYLKVQMDSFQGKDLSSLPSEESLKALYLQAIENFELMLDFNENDLQMIQIIFFYSLQCKDYWTFENLLTVYSEKFNRFYSKYLQEQWQILSKLPKCSSSINIDVLFSQTASPIVMVDSTSASAGTKLLPEMNSLVEGIDLYHSLLSFFHDNYFVRGNQSFSCQELIHFLQTKALEIHNKPEDAIIGQASEQKNNDDEQQPFSSSQQKNERRVTRNFLTENVESEVTTNVKTTQSSLDHDLNKIEVIQSILFSFSFVCSIYFLSF
jgi:hypothetical protein